MGNKIIIICCYYGNLPEWFNIWLKTCENNYNYDFLIITDNVINNLPPNVLLLNEALEDLRKRFSKVLGFEAKLESPYKLCDYRPIYGKAFRELIKDYKFWGHCDIDLLWGNLNNFITENILANYDLIGIHGHLMIYRNNEKMNNLYKCCGGTFSYKEVYSNFDNYSFDEMTGINLIAKYNNIKQYYNLKIADISSNYFRFSLSRYPFEKDIFVLKDGKILRASIVDNNINIEEFAYIHFSNKKPKNNLSELDDFSNLYLTSKEIKNRLLKNFTIEEIKSESEFINENDDRKQLKKCKNQKLKKILRKTLHQKVIWIKIQIALWKNKKEKVEK